MEYVYIDPQSGARAVNRRELVREIYPGISFPAEQTADLTHLDVYPLEDTPQPEVDGDLFAVQPDGVEEVAGVWKKKWLTVARVIQPQDVRREMVRRIGAGFTVTRNTTDYVFESTTEEREEITLLANEALRFIAEGGLPTDDNWFNGGTVNVQTYDGQSFTVSARQMTLLGKALMEHIRGHREAARALVAQSPIPATYKDDANWPPNAGLS